jgi:tetratricopeptide (TPR) repeat protein
MSVGRTPFDSRPVAAMHQVTRRARQIDRFEQLFIVGNLLLALLLIGGIARSVLIDGRLPNIRVGYSEIHQRLIETGKQTEVIPDLRTAASINFDDGFAQLQLLSTASEVNDTESAILGLRGLLNHSPDDPELHGELAMLLLGIGQLEDALVHSRLAVKLDPASARLQTTQGAVMLALGRNRAAADCYRKALGLNPDSEAAQRALKYPLKNY